MKMNLNRQKIFQPSEFRLQPFLDAPIKNSPAQFLYINWRPGDRNKIMADEKQAFLLGAPML
jgi:hypothetical protein